MLAVMVLVHSTLSPLSVLPVWIENWRWLTKLYLHRAQITQIWLLFSCKQQYKINLVYIHIKLSPAAVCSVFLSCKIFPLLLKILPGGG